MILLDQMPHPPSINKRYRINFKERKFHPGASTQAYKKQVDHWFYSFIEQIGKAKKEAPHILDLKNGQLLLQIELHLFKETIFRKDGKPKRYDLDNRLKSLIDTIATAIEIDDKHFFRIEAEKIQTSSDKEFARAWIS